MQWGAGRFGLGDGWQLRALPLAPEHKWIGTARTALRQGETKLEEGRTFGVFIHVAQRGRGSVRVRLFHLPATAYVRRSPAALRGFGEN